jgi:chromosome partitioning protein
MYADAIVMPVSNSLFDRTSAADCLAELRTLPRVQSGRCRVAAVGMRIDPATEAGDLLRTWAAEQKLPLVAVLPQSHAYVRCAEQGLTLFDMPQVQVEGDITHWRPLLQWMRPLLQPAANAGPTMRSSAPVGDIAARNPAAPVVDQPKPETLSRGPRSVAPLQPAEAPVTTPPRAEADATSAGRLRDALPLPRFLQRKP